MKTNKKSYTLKSGNVPMTRKMLFGVRDELMKRLNSHDRKFEGISGQLGEMNARMDNVRSELKSEINSVKSELRSELRAVFERLSAEIRRVGVLVEDQNARNLYVLDGISSHSYRFRDIEDRLGHLEKDWKVYKKQNP